MPTVRSPEFSARVMGVASFFVFVAFNPTQALTTLEDSVNGAISLAVLYLTFMLTSLFIAVPIVQRFGPKIGLLGSSWTYLLFVAARSLPADLKVLRLSAMYLTAFGVGAGGAVLWTSIGNPCLSLYFHDTDHAQALCLPRLEQVTLFSPKSAQIISTVFFFLNSLFAYAIVFACTRLQLPSNRMYLMFCLICTVGCCLFALLPKDVIVVKSRKTLTEKLLLTSRHMQRRSVYTLLPMWAYHHFVLAYSTGVVPQLANDPSIRSLVLFTLGLGICGGSFGSFCIAPTVRRVRVLAAVLVCGSVGIVISGFENCASGMCPLLCFAAACMGVSWGCIPGNPVCSYLCLRLRACMRVLRAV